MEWYTASALLMGLAIVFLGFGIPVAFAFLLTNVIAVLIFVGDPQRLSQIVLNASSIMTSYALVPIPLFLLKGAIFFRSGLANLVFDAAEKCMGNVHGRLAYLTIIVGTVFASMTGSGMATTAMLGAMLVPEMLRRGYSPALAIGPILGVGGVAMIIPPSALAVLFGSLARIDIGALLVAGTFPALLLSAGYMATVRIQLWLNPALAPVYATDRLAFTSKVWLLTRDVAPMLLVIFGMVGLLVLGIATPSESAAFGVAGMVILTFLYRRFSARVIIESLRDTLAVTGMVFFLILNSSTFSQMLAYSGAASGIVRFASSLALGPHEIILMMLGIVVLLGCFMDAISIMLLAIPVFAPIIFALGIDPIWFGILILIGLEVGTITPPFGLHLFIMQGMAPKGTTFRDVVRAGAPFLAATFIILGFLVAFPGIVTFFRDFLS